MMKFDHLAIPVSDVGQSRDWYVSHLGLAVEFEVAERRLIALQDSEGFAIFLQEAAAPVQPGGCRCGSKSRTLRRPSPLGAHAGSRSPMVRRNSTGATVPSSSIRTAIGSGCGTNGR